MDDETLLVASLIGGVVAMIVGIVTYQRRNERTLATQTTIERPIESVGRTVAVVLPAAIVMPVVVGAVGALTDPWMRGHALGAVLVSIFGAGFAIVGSVLATRRWRRIGGLTLTPDRLELDVEGVVNHVDITQPFELVEAQALQPQGIPLQIVVVTQDGRSWAFGYGLTITQTARGQVIDGGRCPLVGAGARVIHDRLHTARQAFAAPVPADDVVVRVAAR